MINKFKAVLLGLACGDALGHPTEFKSVHGIRQAFGPKGIQDIHQTNGRFTDDTQMTVALALGILDRHASVSRLPADEQRETMSDPERVMPPVGRRFVEWAFGPDNNRAPGNTCMSGCRSLANGKPWTESGVKHSKGCGSAMRSSPVGLVYGDYDQLRAIAKASSIVTHGHLAAVEAAHIAALVVRLLLDGADVEDLLDSIRPEVTEPNFVKLLDRIEPLIEKTINGEITPEEAQTFQGGLGESWTGDEAVASALYCFLLADRLRAGYVMTVRLGANTKGDSDSIAAIAGSFAGARWGIGGEKGVPQDWIDHVEDGKEISKLAERLYSLNQALTPEPADAIEG